MRRRAIAAALLVTACGPSKPIGVAPDDGGGTDAGAPADAIVEAVDAVETDGGDAAPVATACVMTGPGTYAVTLPAGRVLNVGACFGVLGGSPLVLDETGPRGPLPSNLARWSSQRRELLLAGAGRASLHFYVLGEFEATKPPAWDLDLTVVASDLAEVTVATEPAQARPYEQTRGRASSRITPTARPPR